MVAFGWLVYQLINPRNVAVSSNQRHFVLFLSSAAAAISLVFSSEVEGGSCCVFQAFFDDSGVFFSTV